MIDVYGFSPVNIIALIDGNATATNIQNAIYNLSNMVGADDEVVFFYSGHGARGRADDGDKERIDEAIVSHDGTDIVYIWDGQLKDWFSGFATSRIVFVFDTCLAGGMTDLSAPGRVLNMAASERGYSYEGDIWGHGEFTYYFVVKGMNEGKADIYDHNNNGYKGESFDVVVEEAYDYAKANCQYDKPTVSDEFDNDLLL